LIDRVGEQIANLNDIVKRNVLSVSRKYRCDTAPNDAAGSPRSDPVRDYLRGVKETKAVVGPRMCPAALAAR